MVSCANSKDFTREVLWWYVEYSMHDLRMISDIMVILLY